MAAVTLHKGEECRTIHVKPGETLHQAFARLGIFHHAPCGGQKLCHNCKLRVQGAFLPPSNHEAELLTDQELLQGIRFACMAIPDGDCHVYFSDTVALQEPPSAFEPGLCFRGKTGYACGVDIGTTTLGVYLYNQATGTKVGSLSMHNEQAVFGADVISRIEATRSPGVLLQMQQTVARQLGEMITSLCQSESVALQEITACAIAGNTTMLHLLTGIDPAGIAVAPFTPSSLFGTVYRGEQLGLPLACDVFLIPCISAYVGGDITAGIVACDMDKGNKTILLIDVGTNGEMALCKKGEPTVYCLSTAAGPAFEGAHISQGVGGIPGAICKVDNSGIQTIDGRPPVGICGSGLLDAIALMLQQGVLEETGFLEEDYFLSPQHPIAITPQDIREVQLAKSAICSGVIRLMELANVQPEEIDVVLFAGGFGSHLNPKSAAAIGMLPSSLAGKCTPVGNTAGLGAVMASLSDEARERMEILPDSAVYFELSGDERFNQLFIENMLFTE